jgi:hypothetical protein
LFTDNHELRHIPHSLQDLPTNENATALTNSDIEQGAQVLVLFWQCLPLCSKISQRLYVVWDIGVVWRQLIDRWHDGARRLLGGDYVQMGDATLVEKCRETSRLIWENSGSDDAIDEKTTFELWANSFTGQRLRWETIGTVCPCNMIMIDHV